MNVLNGILLILGTRSPWAICHSDIPKSTCHRYCQAMSRSAVFTKILTALAEDLRDRGGIDLSEGFMDSRFAQAKKMGWCSQGQNGRRHQDRGHCRVLWSCSGCWLCQCQPVRSDFGRGGAAAVRANHPARTVTRFGVIADGGRPHDYLPGMGNSIDWWSAMSIIWTTFWP